MVVVVVVVVRIMVELFTLFFCSQFLEHYGFNLIFFHSAIVVFFLAFFLVVYFLLHFDLFFIIAWSSATPLVIRKYLNVVKKRQTD